MSQREETLSNETGRILALQEERLHIQSKTFTKWINSFLSMARMEVEDIFTDLADGKRLLKLLEIISGEKLGKLNNGRMRVHKIENVNKSLTFLREKVSLNSIGAEDIVDGNPTLILGLIWTIILRFQVQELKIDVDEEDESSKKTSAKDALLLWCQRKTSGYPNVNIRDFSGSWRSGLGFNALIHAHRPDLIEFEKLVPSNHIDNLTNAFDVAERQLGIAKLLDPEDCDTAKPDEASLITYVALYHHTFEQMYKKDKTGQPSVNTGRRPQGDEVDGLYDYKADDLKDSEVDDLKDNEADNWKNSEVDDLKDNEADNLKDSEVDDLKDSEVDDLKDSEVDDLSVDEADNLKEDKVDDEADNLKEDKVDDPNNNKEDDEADDLKTSYELGVKTLLVWIRQTIAHLNSRDFPSNLEGVQKLLHQFKEYTTVEKPLKYNEKSELQENYFIIKTRLKEYVPSEGLLVLDIERAWEELEKSEYQRELALQEEFIRQTNLQQKKKKKSVLREGHLTDIIQALSAVACACACVYFIRQYVKNYM